MAKRDVRTSELSRKFHLSSNTVKAVLKKAKVKPTMTWMTDKCQMYMWPNREANAALRAYRVEVPYRARRPKAIIKQVTSNVSSLSEARFNHKIDRLFEEIARLRSEVQQALGIRKTA